MSNELEIYLGRITFRLNIIDKKKFY